MNSSHVMLILILVFFASWLYTEVVEHFDRVAFVEEVNDFMHRGDRFTLEDGERLELQICRIDPNCTPKN